MRRKSTSERSFARLANRTIGVEYLISPYHSLPGKGWSRSKPKRFTNAHRKLMLRGLPIRETSKRLRSVSEPDRTHTRLSQCGTRSQQQINCRPEIADS